MKPKKKYGKALWVGLFKGRPVKGVVALKRKFVRRISKSMATKLKEYSKLRAAWLSKLENCICHVCVADPSTDVHHKKGRGKYLCATETWLAVCRTCHRHIHNNPKWAYEKGYLIKR